MVSVQGRLVVTDGGIEPTMSSPGHLGGNDHRIAWPAGHPLSQPVLGQSNQLRTGWHWIEFRIVKEIDAGIKGPVHDAESRLLPRLSPKSHRSHADLAHHDPARPQSALLHDAILSGNAEVASREQHARNRSACTLAALPAGPCAPSSKKPLGMPHKKRAPSAGSLTVTGTRHISSLLRQESGNRSACPDTPRDLPYIHHPTCAVTPAPASQPVARSGLTTPASARSLPQVNIPTPCT